MTDQEREIITRFIQRVGGAPQGGGFGGSVPATAPALPPIDREADALIADLFTRYPEARYRLTQTAFVQEAALAEAQNRIKRLEWELEQARQAAQQAQQGGSPWGAQGGSQAQPQQQQSRGGFFSGLFGGGQQQQQQQAPQYAPPPQYAAPPPQYPPSYQPGMFRSGGSGFLGSALSTAAGVAGGVVVGNALMDLFSGHHGFGGGYGGFAGPGMSETVVNNYYEGGAPQGGDVPDPWAGAGQDPGNAGFQDVSGPGGAPDPFSQAGGDPGGFQDAGMDPGSDAGWDNSGDPGGMDDDNLI